MISSAAQIELGAPAFDAEPAPLGLPCAEGLSAVGRRLRLTVAFMLLVLVTATLFLRPADLLPDLEDLPIYEVLTVACLIAALPEVLEQLTAGALAASPITVCVVGILIAIVASHLSHADVGDAWFNGVEFVKVLLYYLLLVGVIDNPAQLRRFLSCMAILIAILAAIPLLQHHGFIELETISALDDHGVDRNTGQALIYSRLQGPGIFHDPNDLCHIMGVGVVLCLQGLFGGRFLVLRALWLAPIAALLWAMVLTQSRGGIIALAAGLAVFALLRFRWKRALILGACAGPLLLGLLSGRQADLSLDTETSRERIQLWNDALDLFRAHPVLGVGQGNFERAEGLVAHNSFIQCFVELGWVGGGCFVAGFYLAMRFVLQRPAPNPAAAPLGSSLAFRPYLAAAIAAYVIGMMSLTRSYLVPTYLMLGLATAYSRVRPAAGGAAGPRLSGRLVSELLLVSLAFLAGAFLWIRASVHWQ
ncbi:MAG: hypothetical protein JWP03_2485 [Phycisphaerales bacterium]|nr:hypothetical protein [Phycisphaerales bacterium]